MLTQVERIEAHVAVPERGTKFRTKRQADAVARLLADHGHEIEWVRKNYGAQRESTWNVRLSDGTEVHLPGSSKTSGWRSHAWRGRRWVR